MSMEPLCLLLWDNLESYMVLEVKPFTNLSLSLSLSINLSLTRTLALSKGVQYGSSHEV